MGSQVRQAVAYLVEATADGPRLGERSSQGAEGVQEGQDDEEQDGQPNTIRGQRLSQDGKRDAHQMNLLDARLNRASIRIQWYYASGPESRETVWRAGGNTV